MKVYQNYPLKDLNAFKVEVKTKYFVVISNSKDLKVLKPYAKEKIYILGNGTNTLFTKNFDGVVAKINIKGIKIKSENKNTVKIQVGSGENWHEFVTWAVEHNFGGTENLALIPGQVGSSPIQNIGAYGTELSQILDSLKTYEIETDKERTFTKYECGFSYRNSIFKHELKNKFIITSVTFILTKNPVFDISYTSPYDSLSRELENSSTKPYTIKDVYDSVVKIRKRKFPDWIKLGTAGSFFLNPMVNKKKLSEIKAKYPDMQIFYASNGEKIKLPAGWLLEQIGWGARRIGNVGTFDYRGQALVVVNYGGATPQEILSFTQQMQKDFYSHFDIRLEPEVNIV